MRQAPKRSIEELAQLLDGQVRPDDVGPEARRLAQVATTLVEERPVALPTLDADARADLRARLLFELSAQSTPVTAKLAQRVSAARRRVATSARAAMASGLASAMIGTTGVAFAAQEALPGDALYSLKRTTESARLVLAGDLLTLGRLELRFAEERLEEVTRGLGRLSADEVAATLAYMDQMSVDGAEHLIRAVERGEDEAHLAELSDFIDRQVVGLLAVMGRLPIDARPQAETSLGVLRRIRVELLHPLMLSLCDCITVAGQDTACTCGPDGDLLLQLRGARDPVVTTEDGVTDAARQTGRATTSTDVDVTDGSTSVDDSVDDTRVLVPELPGPLSGVGDAVDRTAKELLDQSLDSDSSLSGPVGDVVDTTTDLLEDAANGVTDTLDSTVDGAGSSLDGLLGND